MEFLSEISSFGNSPCRIRCLGYEYMIQDTSFFVDYELPQTVEGGLFMAETGENVIQVHGKRPPF